MVCVVRTVTSGGGKEEADKEDGKLINFNDFEVPATVSREPQPRSNEENST